jgi:hypothetical protein
MCHPGLAISHSKACGECSFTIIAVDVLGRTERLVTSILSKEARVNNVIRNHS